jgi:hypothetical protein
LRSFAIHISAHYFVDLKKTHASSTDIDSVSRNMMPPPPPRIGLSARHHVGGHPSSQLFTTPFDRNNSAPERSLRHRSRSKSSSSSDSDCLRAETAKRNKKPAKANDRSRSKSSSSTDSEFSAAERAKRNKKPAKANDRSRPKSSSSTDSEFSAAERAKRNKKPAKANDRSRPKSSSSSDSEFSVTERAKRKKPIYNPGEHFGESSGESEELTNGSTREHIEANGTRVLQEYDCEEECWYRIATFEDNGTMYWCTEGENN